MIPGRQLALNEMHRPKRRAELAQDRPRQGLRMLGALPVALPVGQANDDNEGREGYEDHELLHRRAK